MEHCFDGLKGIALAIAKKPAIAPESFLNLGDTDVGMQTAGARKMFDHPCDVMSFLS
jgi:hypothetical protein